MKEIYELVPKKFTKCQPYFHIHISFYSCTHYQILVKCNTFYMFYYRMTRAYRLHGQRTIYYAEIFTKTRVLPNFLCTSKGHSNKNQVENPRTFM